MSSVGQPLATPLAAAPVTVTRSRHRTGWLLAAAVVVVAVLAYLPYIVYSGTTNLLVNVFIIMTMASMWNLLAGYAGLVSVGQQFFVGLGAYLVLILAQHGLNPFLAIVPAVVACTVVGVPVWWLVRRLRTAYFAIATWVIASVGYLVILLFPSLGGGTGAPLPGLSSLNATLLTAYTYWASLVVVVVALAATYLLLRSRIGLVLTAVRDDETAARSAGARVGRTQRLVFLVAAAGCAAAGTLVIISQLGVEPTSAFSVNWSAEMIFATIIGGIGSIEGPIIGTVVFIVLQETLSSYGAWYFIVLGLVAIAVAIWSRRGLWGVISGKLDISVFPIGYYLWPAGAGRPSRRFLRSGPGGGGDGSRSP